LLYINPHDKKYGWLSNHKYKVQAINHAAAALRDGACILHSRAAINELAILDAGTLRAPQGFHDDLAMCVIIGLAALEWSSTRGRAVSVVIPGRDPLDEIDQGRYKSDRGFR
jgi:hypothetical protein